MSAKKKESQPGEQINTGGGAYVEGNVDTGGGDFVGRDKIDTLIKNLQQTSSTAPTWNARRSPKFFVIAPGAQGEVVKWLVDQQGVDKRLLESLGIRAATPTAPSMSAARSRKCKQPARSAARGVPIAPQAAYKMGMLAAYRRDYEVALDYFRRQLRLTRNTALPLRPSPGCSMVERWNDLARGDYDAAIDKLEAARRATRQTDPLDSGAMALRGYIAKTLAQVCAIRGDQAGRQQYHAEAAPCSSRLSSSTRRMPRPTMAGQRPGRPGPLGCRHPGVQQGHQAGP